MKQLRRSSPIRVQLPLLSGQRCGRPVADLWQHCGRPVEPDRAWKRWPRTCVLSESTSYLLWNRCWIRLLDRWNQWNKYTTSSVSPLICYMIGFGDRIMLNHVDYKVQREEKGENKQKECLGFQDGSLA